MCRSLSSQLPLSWSGRVSFMCRGNVLKRSVLQSCCECVGGRMWLYCKLCNLHVAGSLQGHPALWASGRMNLHICMCCTTATPITHTQCFPAGVHVCLSVNVHLCLSVCVYVSVFKACLCVWRWVFMCVNVSTSLCYLLCVCALMHNACMCVVVGLSV